MVLNSKRKKCQAEQIRVVLRGVEIAKRDFDYCSVVWHSCGTTLSQKIERVQNYAMRVILGKPPLTPSESLRQELGWTTLQQRREIKMLLQVHRCLNGRAPKYLMDKFITNADFGCRVTRGEAKLHLSRPNTDFYRRSFEFQGGLLWNSLPSNTRTITSKNTFKHALTSNTRTITSKNTFKHALTR